MSGHNSRRFYQLHYQQVAGGKARRAAKVEQRREKWAINREEAMAKLNALNFAGFGMFLYMTLWSVISLIVL